MRTNMLVRSCYVFSVNYSNFLLRSIFQSAQTTFYVRIAIEDRLYKSRQDELSVEPQGQGISFKNEAYQETVGLN